jgi:aryl-alcohol dehydrogenase-like predicted oxidoreductase
MAYRRVGPSGLQVSVIGRGTHNFGPHLEYPAAEHVLHQAVEAGINFLETSNTSGDGQANAFIGQAWRGHRAQVLLATKVASTIGDGPNRHGASHTHILEQIDISLPTLQTEALDLSQIHDAPFTPLEDTLRTMDHLVRQGKVRDVGCSNCAAWQVAEALGTARTLGLKPLARMKPEDRLRKRAIENARLPCGARSHGGILPYVPRASGCLTGTYRRRALTPAGGPGLRLGTGPSPGEQRHGRRHHPGTHHCESQGGGLAPLGRREGGAGWHPASAGPHVGHPDDTPAAVPAVVGVTEP